MQTTEPVAEATSTTVLVMGCQQGVGADDTLRILRDAGLPEEGREAAAKRLKGDAGVAKATTQIPAVVDPDTAAGIADLAQWLADVPFAHLLLLHQRPERPVAGAIANGEAVDDALAEWRRTAEALLAVCRRDRRRVSLLNAHAAVAAPGECLARLGNRLKQRLPKASTSAVDTTPETPVMERAIAALAVQQSEDTQALLSELEASSLPVGDPLSLVLPDTESVVQAFSTHNARQQLEEENELLLMQLQQVQEELESYYFGYQEIEQKCKAAEDERASYKKKSEELERSNRYYRDQLQRAQHNIADIKKSLSWKLTIPLRAVRGGPRKKRTASGDGG